MTHQADEQVALAPLQGQLLDAAQAPGSSNSVSLILIVMKLVIDGAVSMRAASRISGLICELLNGHRLDGISHATVQNYLLRVGLDRIQFASDTCSDRIWIIDHMIAAGSLKCLVVLGIRAQVFAKLDRPLEHGDVDVLTLQPTEVSTGAVVKDQLATLASRRGVPLALLSDSGSDLKKGVELFRQQHPETISLYDIVHLTSRLMWKQLSKEDRFSSYRQACCQCANKLRQSQLAHLKPPRPKTKARYMNLDPEIRWGRRALWLLDRVRRGELNDRQQKRLNNDLVEAQLGWLEDYRDELETWTEMCQIGQASCSVVRRVGYSQATIGELQATLGTGRTADAQQLIQAVTSVVKQQCDSCKDHAGPLPGSSEVIESIIGKGKRLLGTSQNNNSLTCQILSLAAITATLTATSLLDSLKRCRLSHVRSWINEHIKAGIHVARREDLTDPDKGTKLAQI